MKVRKLSPTGDYLFGAGLLNFYIDVPLTIGQIVETTLRLIYSEWYLDTTLGVPYFQSVMGKNPQAIADLTIQNAVLNVNGVINIISYNSQINSITRGYSATININTIYGEAEVTVQLSTFPAPPPVLIPELITQSGFFITTQSGENIST